MRKRVFLKIGAVIMATLFCLQEKTLAEEDPFEGYADELITNIKRNTRGEVSVAIWPFRAEDLSVPQATAVSWNEKLLSALVRKKPGYLRVVSREDLKTLLLETYAITSFEEVDNPTETLARNAKVSFLIIGKIRPTAGGVELFYEGLEVETGNIVAATRHRRIPLDLGKAEEREKTLTLTAAITQAAKEIAGRNLGMETLEIDGLREKLTKSVPPFSDYFIEKLVSEIEREISSTIVGYRLKVMDAVFPEAGNRGMSITPGAKATPVSTPAPDDHDDRDAPDDHDDPDIPNDHDVPNIPDATDDREARSRFRLSGSYWVFPNYIDIFLTVQNDLGERAGWEGRIARASVPGELIIVRNAAPDEEDIPRDDIGPIGLKLSTNKGAHPRFRLGETMKLHIEVQRDAYLNCYYRQADGVALRFFPNRHMTTDNKVMAGELNILPRTDRISFNMKEPEGEEKLHCFATDRPVASKLPDALVTDLTPIPQADFRNLSAAFRSIPDIRLSEASMTVTVRD